MLFASLTNRERGKIARECCALKRNMSVFWNVLAWSEARVCGSSASSCRRTLSTFVQTALSRHASPSRAAQCDSLHAIQRFLKEAPANATKMLGQGRSFA